MNYRFVFIGGLHRSGTSALYRLLGSDRRVSIFRNTGVIEDEGQFLQTVYPRDNAHGGPGLFCLDKDAHLTEASPLVASACTHLFKEWAPYWDLKKPILAEKSPANIIRSRFLQAVFPNSAFICIMRHPVANALATTKWSGAYMTTLIENWLRCHEVLFEDVQKVRDAVILKYEDFTVNPHLYEPQLRRVLGIEPALQWDYIQSGFNAKYYHRWKKGDFHLRGPRWKNVVKRWRNVYEVFHIERKYEGRINQFGYSFADLDSA